MPACLFAGILCWKSGHYSLRIVICPLNLLVHCYCLLLQCAAGSSQLHHVAELLQLMHMAVNETIKHVQDATRFDYNKFGEGIMKAYMIKPTVKSDA